MDKSSTGTYLEILREAMAKAREILTDDEKAHLLSPATDGKSDDPVNHPSHYTSHPSGVECIQVTEHMNFNLGNATKYIWRAGLKSESPIEDLKKAEFYIKREIERIAAQHF